MTLKDLKELAGLERLVEKERERLQTLRDSLDLKAQTISDMPRGGGAQDRIGTTLPRIIDEAKKVIAKEFPEYAGIQFRVPDEKFKRHGQAVVAASLPALKK